MININVMDRGTGKTTTVINEMKKDSELICLVPNRWMVEHYPEEVQNRVYSTSNLDSLRGKQFSKVILDEGLIYDKVHLAELYYQLGKLGVETTVYTS